MWMRFLRECLGRREWRRKREEEERGLATESQRKSKIEEGRETKKEEKEEREKERRKTKRERGIEKQEALRKTGALLFSPLLNSAGENSAAEAERESFK